MKGMALAEAEYAQTHPFQGAVPADSLGAILGARRVKTAGPADPRREASLVRADQEEQNVFHGLAIPGWRAPRLPAGQPGPTVFAPPWPPARRPGRARLPSGWMAGPQAHTQTGRATGPERPEPPPGGDAWRGCAERPRPRADWPPRPPPGRVRKPGRSRSRGTVRTLAGARRTPVRTGRRASTAGWAGSRARAPRAEPSWYALHGEPAAPRAAAVRQDLAAVRRAHAGAESVFPFAFLDRWLIGSFHGRLVRTQSGSGAVKSGSIAPPASLSRTG